MIRLRVYAVFFFPFFWVATVRELANCVRAFGACLHYNKVCNKIAMYMQMRHATKAEHSICIVCVTVGLRLFIEFNCVIGWRASLGRTLSRPAPGNAWNAAGVSGSRPN